jgi:hypothetical protein
MQLVLNSISRSFFFKKCVNNTYSNNGWFGSEISRRNEKIGL